MKNKVHSKTILNTPRFNVIHDEVADINGLIKDFYYINKPNAIGIILTNKNKIGLVKIKRHLLDQSFYEIVGGRIENEEEPIDSAKRELFEEVGLASELWTFLNVIFPLPSVTTEKVFLFTVEVSDEETIKLETEEGIEIFCFFSYDEILTLIKTNQINNSVDGFAILYYLNLKNGL